MTKWDHPKFTRMIQQTQISVIHHFNKRKVKKAMTISIDAEKASDKIHHPFMITTLTKVGIEGTYFNILKAHSKRNTQWRKAESLPTKTWNKTRMPTLPLLSNTVSCDCYLYFCSSEHPPRLSYSVIQCHYLLLWVTDKSYIFII